jgi:SPOR domain
LVGYLLHIQSMKYILSFTALLLVLNISAQDTAIIKKIDSNSVIIHKDSRIDLLVKKQAYVNEVTSRDSKRTDKGFRLMIISTNNREEAIAAKTKVYTYFPELKAYLWHQSPYYKVKAGNFRDREDAESYRRRLNSYFPKGVFIMKDTIEAKPEKEKDKDKKDK